LGVCAFLAALAGCGGSGSANPERTKLVAEVAAQMRASNSGAELAACVGQQSRGLPTVQLRKLANAGSDPDAAIKMVAARLLTTCIEQGKGVAQFRALIVQVATGSAGTTIPPAFKSCLIARVNAASPSQLAQLVAAYGAGGQSAEAPKVGAEFATQCLDDPAVLAAARQAVLAPLRAAFKTSHYSTAFQNCLITKTNQIPAPELKRWILDPATAESHGAAFGKHAAEACIASGAKP
jgi:hypothetical protein